MPRVAFTQNLQRHIACPAAEVPGQTVHEVLESVFHANPKLRGYILDDQGAVRKHMVVFLDGEQIKDREALTDPVGTGSQLYVMQALSGG